MIKNYGVAAVLLTLLACGETADRAPRVADLSTDTHTTLIDRAELLDGAVDYDQADRGELLDLTAAGDGYLMAFDGEEVTSHADDLDRMYTNYLAGVAAVVGADLTTAVVVGPPAIGIGFAASGDIDTVQPNVWRATNEIEAFGETLQTVLTVTWVGTGYISEMRYSTDEVTDQLWFNGFVSNYGAIGWWDLYDENGQHAGVIEWTTDGVNGGQFGFAATAGENAGDYLIYGGLGWNGGIYAWDESEQEEAYVYILADYSGGVRLPEYNGGVEGCWDTDFLDTDCPAQ